MTASHNRLLIVDADICQIAQLADLFACYGLQVAGAASPAQMRTRLAEDEYALVVLDTAVAPGQGAALLRELAIERRLPVIVHSALSGDADRIAALEMGAEDCLHKPANPRELLARIRATLRGLTSPARRKAGPSMNSLASFEGWRVDMTTGQLFDPTGAAIALSDGEFQLLRVFVEHPRQVLDRSRLLDRVHGATSDHYDRSIDVQLCRLRRKLSASGLKGPVIRTIRNEGYMFVHAVTH